MRLALLNGCEDGQRAETRSSGGHTWKYGHQLPVDFAVLLVIVHLAFSRFPDLSVQCEGPRV